MWKYQLLACMLVVVFSGTLWARDGLTCKQRTDTAHVMDWSGETLIGAGNFYLRVNSSG